VLAALQRRRVAIEGGHAERFTVRFHNFAGWLASSLLLQHVTPSMHGSKPAHPPKHDIHFQSNHPRRCGSTTRQTQRLGAQQTQQQGPAAAAAQLQRTSMPSL